MLNILSLANWLTILAAFVPYFILGVLWFTLFFPKAYRISLGRENEPAQKPSPIFIIGPALCTLVITIASAVLMHALNIDSYGDAVQLAAIVGFGYLVANTFNIAINPNIPRPLLYGLISGAYHLVGIIIACMILVVMK